MSYGCDHNVKNIRQNGKDGLLKRENNPVSRRSWNVLLTDYGSQKADEVIRIFNRIDNVIYNGFSEEEVQTLSVMAGKVEKNLWEAIKNEEQK